MENFRGIWRSFEGFLDVSRDFDKFRLISRSFELSKTNIKFCTFPFCMLFSDKSEGLDLVTIVAILLIMGYMYITVHLNIHTSAVLAIPYQLF